MTTPNLENFDYKAFVEEVRAFMKYYNISTRKLAELTGSSLSTLPRMAKGDKDILIGTVARFQRVMRTFKPDDA